MSMFNRKKYKSLKRQTGGSFQLVGSTAPIAPRPFVPPQFDSVGIAPTPTAPTGGKPKTDNNKDKEFKGLPSDVGYAYQKQAELQQLETSMDAEDFLGGTPIYNQWRKLQNELYSGEMQNKLTTNKEQYDQADAKIKDNKAEDAIAVDKDGKILVETPDGGVVKITVEEYMRNRDKVRAISAPNLLLKRFEDPNFAFENSVLEIAESSIGLQKINEYIDIKLSHLGESKWSNAAKQLQEITSQYGDYEMMEVLRAGGNNAKQIEDALAVTLALLPPNMLAQLKYQIARRTNSPEEMTDELSKFLQKNFSRALKTDIQNRDMASAPIDFQGRGGAGGSKDDSHGVHAATYYGDFAHQIVIGEDGSRNQLRTLGKQVPVDQKDLTPLVTNSFMASVGDLSQARDAQGKPLSQENISAMVFKPGTQIQQIIVPVDNNGNYSQDGKAKLEKAVADLRKEGTQIVDAETTQRLASSLGIQYQMAYAATVITTDDDSEGTKGKPKVEKSQPHGQHYTTVLEKAGIDYTRFDNWNQFDRGFVETTVIIPINGNAEMKIRGIDKKDFYSPRSQQLGNVHGENVLNQSTPSSPSPPRPYAPDLPNF